MKQLFAAIFVFFISISSATAQNFEKNLATYANNFTSERIYLHYDKSSYAAGETVWFKLYMMQTIFAADDSKTVYIDWSDPSGKLLLHTISPVQDGTAFGQFTIPDNYKGEFLHVRSYTKWMLNFDSSFLYNKDIRILSDSGAAPTKVVIKPEIEFFPEGGDIIDAVNNKIAFKANDQYGRPVKVKGVIKNGSGEVVDKLEPVHDGMGFFYLMPHAADKYTAYWEDEKGTQHTTPLPSVKNSDVSLQVSISGSKRNFLVAVSPQSVSKYNSVHIVGTEYHQPVFNITKEFSNGITQGVIPTESLPTGILTLTVFDENWVPLAERITYVNNGEAEFHPTMNVKHWGLNKRAKNEIEIEVPDSLSAQLSVSVTDGAIGIDSNDNIISHLLLTGELKGKVYNPAYYFMNTSDSMQQQLDLVMLTHGWRRFNWQKLVAGQFPQIKYARDTSYLSISGKVYGATPTQLELAKQIVLMVNKKNSGTQIFTVPVKPDGSFTDPQLILFDTAKIYYQMAKNNGLDDVSVQFMTNKLLPFADNTKAIGLDFSHTPDTTGDHYHIHLNEALQRELEYYKGKVLATVNIKAKAKSTLDEMDKKYTSGMFSGGDAHEFDLVNDPFAASSLNIFQYLQGKVAGLQINATSNPPTLSWRGGTPSLFMDEMPVTADMISTIPVNDVAFIKVFQPPFMGAVGGGSGGGIAIYTRKGGDEKQEPGKGLSNNTVSGYTLIRQFYSPDYDTFSEENEKKDLRSTLYWDPAVVTVPGKNKVLLKFYNNDITQSFRVIIEGMTKDGRLAHVEQIME
ncbi:MAG: hypothetical protein ABI136_05720 [Ginsengibacter sp.]